MTTPNDSFASPAPVSPGRCPTIEQLIRGACGELPGPEYERILGHVRNCPTCAKAWFSAGGRLKPAEPVLTASAPVPAAATTAAAPPIEATPPVPEKSARGSRTLVIVALVVVTAIVALGLAMALISHLLSSSLSPMANTRSRRFPRTPVVNKGTFPTTTGPAPSLNPSSILRHTAGLGQVLGSLHQTNERFRIEARRPPRMGGGAVFQLQPASGAPANQAVAASRGIEPFSVVLHLPATPLARVDLVAPDGRSIWQRPVSTGQSTVKVNFPAMSLSAGTYHMRAFTPAGAPVAQYTFAVLD